MSLFSNAPGSLKLSSVSGGKKNIPTSQLFKGDKKIFTDYIKIIFVELHLFMGKPELGLISHLRNNPSRRKAALNGLKYVFFPYDLDQLEKLHMRYYISPDLHKKIMRQFY